MLRLCRIYDQESSSLNLVNLLDTIKANLHLFSTENFRERLKENAFVESLASSDRIPQAENINDDIQFAKESNPNVKKLIIWRNTIIAHKGAKVSLGRNECLVNSPLSKEDIESLLYNALKIFNRYSSLYRASSWSSQVIGHDDYKSLLKFAHLGIKKYEDDIKKEEELINERC